MVGTTKQIKWANDIIEVAQKQQEIFNSYVEAADKTDKDVLECLEAIETGFKKFNDINDASSIIYYGKDFKYKRKIDELTVYKTMALLGKYKKISKVEENINKIITY